MSPIRRFAAVRQFICGVVVMTAGIGALTAMATPTATGEKYDLANDQQAENCYDGLIAQDVNLLRAQGVTLSFVEGDLSNYRSPGNKYNGGNYYEKQAEDFNCLADGKISLHYAGQPDGDWNNHWRDRVLVPYGSVATWTWTSSKDLKNIKFYTQWRDGNRNNIAIDLIEVKAGDNWVTLENSTFNYSKDSSKNNVEPYYNQGSAYNRKVTFEDSEAGYLALGITGIRVTFGDQDDGLCYGCYWEIEAEELVRAFGVSDVQLTPNGGSASITGLLNPTADDALGTLVVKYGRSSEALVNEIAVTPESSRTALGFPFETRITGLPMDAEFVYALEYSEGGEVVSAVTNSFATREDYHLLPGLWQARLSGKFNLDGTLASSDNGINRTLGPVMGLYGFSDAGGFPAYTNFDGTEFYWAYQKTYLYQGYIWLEAGTTYRFCSLQDDNGRIMIDGEQVVRSDGWDKSAEGTLTPATTGWHTIDIRSGNDGGGAGRGNGSMLGFGIAVGDGAYRDIIDAGDGAFLGCCVGEGGCTPITVENALLNGDTLTARVAVDVPGEYDLYALYSADYETWTTNSTPLAMNDLGVYEVNDLPAGTLYVRYMAVLGDDPAAVRYSPSVYLPETETTGADPVFDVSPEIVADVDGVDLTLTVHHLGNDATGWTAKLVYWYVEGQESEAALGGGDAIGVFDVAPKGMLPGVAYTGKVIVENSLGRTAESPTFDFVTARFVEIEGVHPAGLRQGKSGCADSSPADYTLTIDDLDPAQTDTTLGLLMAKKAAQGDENNRPQISDAACANSWQWSNKYSSFYYEGLIYLRSGVTIYVESKFDDGVAVFIDDVCVYDEYALTRDSGYNSTGNYTCGSFTPAETGWHKFRAYLWDWAGGKTVMRGVAAVQWTDDPSAVNVSGSGVVTAIADKVDDGNLWHEFYDDGTGSFLRREQTVGRAMRVVAYSATDAGLTATLGFDAGVSDGTLHVVYGDEYGGEGAWDGDVTVGTIGADVTTYDYGTLTGLGQTAKYVRFYLEQPEGRAWSGTICCVDMDRPSFGTSFDVTGMSAGDSLVVSGQLSVLGGSDCDVTVELSRTGDFTDAVSVTVGSFSAAADFTKTLHSDDTSAADYIRPGEVVYIRAKAVNGDGAVGLTPVVRVCPKGEMVLGEIKASSSLWDYTINAEIIDAGMGENPTVELYIDGQLVDSQVVADGQTYVYSGSAETAGEHTYKLVGRNSCPTASTTVESDSYTINLVDNCLYFWKSSVTDGDWSNPDNWDRDGGNPARKTFPNSDKCVARFDNCTSPTTIRVDGKYSVSLIGMGDHRNMQLTFAGVGTPETDNKLDIYHSDDGMVFAPGTDLTLSNVFVDGHCKFHPKADSKTRILYGSTFKVAREYWWVNGSTNTLLEIRGKSKLCVADWTLRAQGGSGLVVVDDSTLEIAKGGVQFEYTQSENDSIDFLFMGANPRLTGNAMNISASHCTSFTFEVPADGFAQPVIACSKDNNTFNPTVGVTTPVIISEDSPARRVRVRTKLIDWPNGIAAAALDFSAQPQKIASCGTCYWTYGADDALNPATDGALPTGLWLSCTATGLTISVR